MHLTKVHLFAILLLALVFCSFFSDICSISSLEGFNSSYNKKSQANKNQFKSTVNNYDEDMSNHAPYNSRRSEGILGSEIPPGKNDLYILKSEIVPPVCPACPAMKCDASNGGAEKKCPPCPPCARCPEPAFDCKKVPNYNGSNDNAFPHPVLNSFSQFGM